MDDGLRKAAIFLLSIETNNAAKVFKHLSERDIELLNTQMSKICKVSEWEVSAVMVDYSQCMQRTVATGSQQTGCLLAKTHDNTLKKLAKLTPAKIYSLIAEEHPQLQAVIFSKIAADKAAQVLMLYSQSVQAEMIYRVMNLGELSRRAKRTLQTALQDKLAKKPEAKSNLAAVNIVNCLGHDNAVTIVNELKKIDSDAASNLQDNLLSFDRLLDIDPLTMQAVLRKIEFSTLIVALKGSSRRVRSKVFASMPRRAVELVKSDVKIKQATKDEIATAQKEILLHAQDILKQRPIEGNSFSVGQTNFCK